MISFNILIDCSEYHGYLVSIGRNVLDNSCNTPSSIPLTFYVEYFVNLKYLENNRFISFLMKCLITKLYVICIN